MLRSAPLVLTFTLLLIGLAGCGTREPYAPILDLVELEQDAGAYHGMLPDKRLLSEEAQQTAYAAFLKEHFNPWERTEPKHTAEEVFWGLTSYEGKPIFGENTLPRDPAWIAEMGTASRVDDYPSMGRKCIAVVNTSMRTLPTNRPAFYDFKRAGEGFPFDYMQNSLVLAGTPLFATHVSADKAWVLVESRFAYGWVPATEIGWVDDAFAAAFQTGEYAAVTRDYVSVTDTKGQFRFIGNVGMLLPVMKQDAIDNTLLGVPARDENGNAVLRKASLPKEYVSPAPIPATPANFARLANTMLGRQYGWGGLYENRDCSATTMDLMAGFGIFLPRNSSKQIMVGTLFPLEDMDLDEKKDALLKHATPFLTLIRKPGHIMLYVGSRDSQPIILHSMWGVKTNNGGVYDRKVIGSTVITTLQPGAELDNLAHPGGLLESVYAFTTLP